MNIRAVHGRAFDVVMALRTVHGINEGMTRWRSERRKSPDNAPGAVYVPDTQDEYEALIAQLVARKLKS